MIAVAGTLVYDGKLGTAALEKLLTDFTFPFDAWDRVGGQFVLFVKRGGNAWLLTDFFAAFHLYHDTGDTLFSTSMLAALGSLDRVSLDPQGVYEYAFNVYPTGSDSIFQELKRLNPRTQVQLAPSPGRVAVEKPLPEEAQPLSVPKRIKQNKEQLRAAITPFTDWFGDNIQCPLSGGLDSRLVLALLRDAGVNPHVYVYGSPDDPDVMIAKGVADGEGFDLEIFEKATAAEISPDTFTETVEAQFHETDALTTDGSLFDNGGNAIARHRRQANGQLPISGGCGEVYRNFFFLPDRPLSARQLVGAFFARFTQSDAGPAFNAKTFLANLETKALAALSEDDPNKPLSRGLIEQLYPRMRCRAFFGREISLVGSQGAYAMPFFDQNVVARALEIPLDLKNAGLFEAQLLKSIDPKLAHYMSGYGYAFDETPSLAQRMGEFATRIRPTWMRRRSYALRRRLGPMEDEHGGLLSNAYLGRVIDLHFPHMRHFFQVENIRDSGIYRRVASLEYLAQHVEDKLN
jgi:asparagine synthase (glutamine-hydrolysing)